MRPPVTSAQSLHVKRFRKGVAVALHLSCMVLVATDPADAGGKTMHAARFASVGGRGLSFREMAEVWGFEHAAGHPKRLGPDVCRHTHGRGPGHASTNLQVCIHAGIMLGAEAPCSSCHFAIIRIVQCTWVRRSPIMPRLLPPESLKQARTLMVQSIKQALGALGARGTVYVECRDQSSSFVVDGRELAPRHFVPRLCIQLCEPTLQLGPSWHL